MSTLRFEIMHGQNSSQSVIACFKNKQLQQESQQNRKQEFISHNNNNNNNNQNKLNGQNFPSQKMQQLNDNSNSKPLNFQQTNLNYNQANQQQQYYANLHNNQKQSHQHRQSTNDTRNNQQFINTNEKSLNSNTNLSTVNGNNISDQQQINYSVPNDIIVPPQPPPHPYFYSQNPNFLNQYNGYSLNAMPLAFPPSFSHQLATLSLDQQKYLLEQQRALVLTLAVTELRAQSLLTEQMAQIQLNQQGI